jgi:hypothetical protein
MQASHEVCTQAPSLAFRVATHGPPATMRGPGALNPLSGTDRRRQGQEGTHAPFRGKEGA